jgi:hypothetical protein
MCEAVEGDSMIYLGVHNSDKAEIVREHAEGRKVVVLSPSKFWFELDGCEFVDWHQIIKYKVFYRLLREIDSNTLVVVNECLRTQNRSDLTYNCIRHFLSQTRHQLVFQWLPIIDSINDLMILMDFDTNSRFKGCGWSDEFKSHVDVRVIDRHPVFIEERVAVSSKTIAEYKKQRQQLFDGIGLKDPHTIPRNLHLIGGADKAAVAGDRQLVGRNNRMKLPYLVTFKDDSIAGERTVFEMCHNYIDLIDFLSLTGQARIPFLTTELKVDHWYIQRTCDWSLRVADAYAKIS